MADQQLPFGDDDENEPPGIGKRMTWIVLGVVLLLVAIGGGLALYTGTVR